MNKNVNYVMYTRGKILKIAHRGMPLIRPENSMISFNDDICNGCHCIELDVRKTKDNVPVVIHDSDLSRTTTGRGKVKDKTLEELNAFELLGCGGEIPTLEQVVLEFELLDQH